MASTTAPFEPQNEDSARETRRRRKAGATAEGRKSHRKPPRAVEPGRWREGNACTTSRLRTIFRDAYTGRDWQGQVCTLEGGMGLGMTFELPNIRRNVRS